MKVTRYTLIAVLFFAVAFATVPGATGLQTQLNISLQEVVNQNVTFAQEFFLTENRTYSLIEGTITVVNPSNDTVFDTAIRLRNISSLDSNFVYASGREGFQRVYPNVTGGNNTFQNGQVNSTAYYDLQVDLDEDGVDDLVTVNNTHIIFNITSEYELRAYAFSNSSNSSMDISSTPAPLQMTESITSLDDDNEYNDGVTFATFTLNGTVTSAGVLNLGGGEVTLQVNDTAREYAIINIPELRSGQQTVFNYNVSIITVEPPLDIDSDYTDPEFNTKVLAGEMFPVTLTASNIATVGALTGVNISLEAENVTVVNGSLTSTFNFTLHNLSNVTGDWTNVTNTSNRTWYWQVGGGTIPIGSTFNISFYIRAPDTVPTSATYLAMTQRLQYRISNTASTLTVTEVRSRAAIDFNTTKQIVSPADNNSNNNVTWRSIPGVSTNQNVTFTLEKVTLWVTTVLDPNEGVSGLNTTYAVYSDLNLTQDWSGTGWLFNFTDGSSDANPPPIVWIKPYWIIKNTQNQIINSSLTVNGTDLYMNYIYVVNGYWLEVEKQVLDAGDSEFDIRVTVRNRGNGYTPQNLTVTVYDFIPEDFAAWNFSPSWNNASNVTGQFTGTAYRWDVGLRTNLSTSFAPRGDPLGLDYFYMNYSVNGSGDFQVSELYVVGLDPRLVDGASSFEGASIIEGIASTSREVIYLAIVLFLIAINVANFMMTHRISRKLDRK